MIIHIERKFDYGYAAPVNRGISFWNGDDPEKMTAPVFTIDDLIYKALGEESYWSRAHDLRDITITIDIKDSELSKAYRQDEESPKGQVRIDFD